jgi:hypothetical protein
MQQYFGDMPQYFAVGKTSGSQFYVRKNRIKRLPKTFYMNMFNFLITNSIKDILYNSDDNAFNEFWMSRYMEWSWEFILTADLKEISI